MFVSTMGTRCPNAKLCTAPTVYGPSPLKELRVAVSGGSRPPYSDTTSRAIAWSRLGLMLYPSGRQARVA